MVSTHVVVIWSCLLLCLGVWPDRVLSDATDGSCTKQFKKGRENFVLDTEEAVSGGASYIDALTTNSPEECVAACCKDLNCNLALVGAKHGSVQNCFLLDCLYKQKYVCRFVKKHGFINYILDSVYGNYLDGPISGPGEEDKHPIANAGQDKVVQPNEIVILNGHQSWDDKKITSYQWTQVAGDTSVVMEKSTNFEDQVELSNLKPGVYKFELKVTDSSDQTDTAQITVLVLTPEQSEGRCLAPKKVGPCRGSFPRWNYNAVTDKCEKFTFGGCKGNHNNYLSEKECMDACKGASGTAGRSLTPSKEVCGKMCQADQFRCDNGCCLDKAQECDEATQCSDGSDEADCKKLNKTLTILLAIDVNERKARCTEPPATGPCRASMTRWYYDPLSRQCHRFNFGGCQGNDNNFEDQGVCMEVCKSVTENDVFARGLLERHEQDETQSGSVAVAAVLAVCILAVLVVLGYCFLKERRKKAQQNAHVVANGAQIPLTDDSENMVYVSTTKPV